MDMYKYIDRYCERLAQGFWNEPVNLLTNALFVVAGLLVIARARANVSTTILSTHLQVYGWLVALVGVGSFSFHGFANRLTVMFDIVAILFCVFYVIYIYGTYILSYGWRKTSLIYIGLIASTILSVRLLSFEIFNGSQGYFGVWLTLGVLALLDKQSPQRYITFQCLGIFAISLVFRSMDEGICHHFPLGTHFLWHTLNAFLLYHLAKRFFVYEKKVVGV